MDTKKVLSDLASACGVSGMEEGAAKAALSVLREFIPSAYIDEFGTVRGFLGEKKNGKPTLMLDAHIDEIGMAATYIEDNGFLRVGLCGGIDRRVLAAQTVTIWGIKPIKGIICTLPPHVAEDDKAVVKKDEIVIDTGYTKAELQKIVTLGDRITVDGEFRELKNDRVTGKAIDDRSGVASILYALSVMDTKKLKYNLAVAFTTQEELGTRGAIISGYSIDPDYSISVDVSFAMSPGCKETKCGKLGKGPMIGIAPILDKQMSDKLTYLAIRYDIPYQLEIMSGETGTNADMISISRGGVKCGLLSIPERYMHTPCEVSVITDIEEVGTLIARFAEEDCNG